MDISTGGPFRSIQQPEAPYNDPEMRWAVNHAINRQQLADIGMQGAGDYTVLPFQTSRTRSTSTATICCGVSSR